jgi:NAD(P)H dehydrogenase (quinone)
MNPKSGVSHMSRVLVYQANGVQGAATLRCAQQSGHVPRALVRDASRRDDFIRKGVEVAVADLTDRDALIRAHESIDFVLLQIPAYSDAFVAQAIDNAVIAMESASVRGAIIKMANPTPSFLVSDTGFSTSAIVRERMRSSPIPWAAIEPTMYLDTFLKPSFRREISMEKLIDLPLASTLKVAWTTVDDAARLTLSVLQMKAWGMTFRCTGDVAYDGGELAAEFSAALGQQIAYREASLDEFQSAIEAAIGPSAAAPVIAKFGFLSQYPEEAQRMLGSASHAESLPARFRPTTVLDWIGMQRAAFS